MALTNSGGTVLNQAALEALTTTVTQPVVRRFTADVYETFTAPGKKKQLTDRRLKYRTGQEVSQTEIDAYYASKVTSFVSISPATGPFAGGTSVTVTVTDTDGVTGVTIGGVALTSFKITSPTTVTGVTGNMGSAGAKASVIQDASGNDTDAGTFTAT